jgi:hypothetical protein
MKGRNPDAIFYGGMDATGGPMLKQARELGIKAQFAFGDGACTAEMAKLAGDKASEGMICSQAGIPTQMASKSFQDAFTKKYGEVKQYAPFFYDAANILIAAIQKADSTDPAKVVSEVAKIKYDGATGHIEFDEKGDRKDAEMTIFQMKAGKVEPSRSSRRARRPRSRPRPPAARRRRKRRPPLRRWHPRRPARRRRRWPRRPAPPRLRRRSAEEIITRCNRSRACGAFFAAARA